MVLVAGVQLERHVPILRPGGQQVDLPAVALKQHALQGVDRVGAVIVVGRAVHLGFPERREAGRGRLGQGALGSTLSFQWMNWSLKLMLVSRAASRARPRYAAWTGAACQPPVSTAWPSAVPSRLIGAHVKRLPRRGQQRRRAQPRLPERIDRIQLGTLADLAAGCVLVAHRQQVDALDPAAAARPAVRPAASSNVPSAAGR